MGADMSPAGRRRDHLLTGAATAAACLPGALVVLNVLSGSAAGPDLCLLHRTTGMWCPLCGGTRATGALLHGNLAEAVGYNPFALGLEVLAVLLVLRWLVTRRTGSVRPLVSAHEAAVVLVIAVVFAVVRNLPGMWVYLGPLLGPAG